MNVWFGTSWGSPMNETLSHVPVPVGQPCLWCDELIADGDSGWGERRDGDHWMHVECFIRSMLGSVAHQLHCCTCRGGPWEDAPLLSKREAALAAWVLHLETRALNATVRDDD